MRVIDESNTLYEMANFGTNTTGEPFTIEDAINAVLNDDF